MNECFPRHMHTYHVLSRKTRNIVLSYSVVNYIYIYIYIYIKSMHTIST